MYKNKHIQNTYKMQFPQQLIGILDENNVNDIAVIFYNKLSEDNAISQAEIRSELEPGLENGKLIRFIDSNYRNAM